MTGQKRIAGSDEQQIPDNRNGANNHTPVKEPSLRPADLRTLIQNRKEREKQLKLRLTLVQAIIEGADTAIFSIDTRCCYSSFNKKHARDMQEIYGSIITAGEQLAGFVPVEKDLQKLLRLIRQALAGEQGAASDYFGDHARSRRYFDISCYPVRNDAGLITGAAVIATDTTVRKKSERTLVEQEERFRRLADDAPDLLYRMTLPEGRYEYVSPVALALTGYPPEEFSKKPGLLYEMVHPSGKDAFGRQQELLMKGKTPPAAEFPIVHSNGDVRWLHFRTTLIRDAAGRPIAVEGIGTDVTDRRNAEMTLRESEELYRELAEHSVDIIYTTSFSGQITSVNPAVFPLLGYQPEELIGKDIRELLTPESQQRMQEEIERKKNGAGSDAFYEVYLQAKDGRSLPFEMNIRIRSEGQKNPDITGIAREIAERKKRVDALEESEERFRTLFQCLPSVAVQGFRPDYTVIFWNEAATRMFGYTADEAGGKDIRELLLPSDAREEITGICDRMALTGIPGPTAEQDLRHKDGTRVPVMVSHAVVKIPGKSTTLFWIGLDLTEHKKEVDALQYAERHLQSILDVAPFGTVVWELHDDGSLVFVSGNQSADRILMTDCSRFAGKKIEEAFPGLTSTGIPDACREAARDGEPFHSDAFAYETEEIKGIFEVHAVPLEENRMAVFFRDISEKRKAEEELGQREARFRALIQNSADLIQILDQEKRLVYTSPAFFTILGYPEGSQNGKNILDLIHPDDRDRAAADLEEVYNRTNPGRPTEYRMLAADGGSRYVESVGVNLLGVPGVDGIMINTHTIHKRKQAEQALFEREERFRLIFQHADDAMYLFEITASGMPGKIVDANDGAVRQTGYAKDELVHKTLLELCSRDLSSRSRAIMMELLTRGDVRFETDTIKKDGSLLPVEISARLAKLENRTFIIAISRDTSQRKREERALRIADQKIQLMNIVAWHDIRNKIAGLRGSVERSKDLVTDEWLKKFRDSEEDVLRVIERQLQITKEYQEMGIHPPQWVNLPQVLRMIVSCRETGPLKFRVDLHDLELYCDPVIEKVFSHLIGNTQKHGEKATDIHISCRDTAGGLLLIYEDDGVGIPRERKKDLFIRGTGSAAGFSLSFVHDILEISDMSIQETGEAGSGVRFEISVPKGLYRIGRGDA